MKFEIIGIVLQCCMKQGRRKFAQNYFFVGSISILILFGKHLIVLLGFRYGYVTPEDVPEIMEKHIGLGHVIDRLWR